MSFEVIESIILTSESSIDAVKNIRALLGGSRIYIPAPENADRNEKIMRDFRGNNHKEVCETHDISMTTLWRIIRLKRK